MKWLPRTVISCWLGQRRQNSRWGPVRMTPGSALTKSFGRSLRGQPPGVGVDDGHDVGGLAVDRDLAGATSASGGATRRVRGRAGGRPPSRPRSGRAARSRAGSAPRRRSSGAPSPRRRATACAWKIFRAGSGHSVPRHRPDERLHVDDAAHALGMAPRPVEARAPSPSRARPASRGRAGRARRTRRRGSARGPRSGRSLRARGPSRPCPTRSGARQRPAASTCGITLRQR